jgi:hypothetical protein
VRAVSGIMILPDNYWPAVVLTSNQKKLESGAAKRQLDNTAP